MCRFWILLPAFFACSLHQAKVLAPSDSQVIGQAKDEQFHRACDFDGFLSAAEAMQQNRKARLISADRFAEFAKDPKTIILDARSEKSFEFIRVRHSLNLPYTQFSSVSLESSSLIPRLGS